MGTINFSVGSKFLYGTDAVIIKRIISADTVNVEDLLNNQFYTLNIADLKPVNSAKEVKIDLLSSKQFDLALHRYNIIKPLLGVSKKLITVKSIANQHKISPATIYRWLEIFRGSNTVSSLAKTKISGGKGQSRLHPDTDIIIRNSISKLYLNSAKYSISKVLRDIKFKCIENKIKPPSASSVRRRISDIDSAVKEKARSGRKLSDEKYSPIKSSFFGGEYPLDMVQIDHCTLDIILVDDRNRRPFKRPFLTLALDIYSRMVTGFYLSFDPPGELATGKCISNSILPKENILKKYDIEGSWPCWGRMKTIHLDNAKEFRGRMISKASQNYGINIEYRPVKTPHIGGHIESFFKTLSKEIHNLPGTTFSNHTDKGEYNSNKRACMTISEFEEWLLEYIVNIYHKTNHSSIKISPLEKYNEGITNNDYGIGILDKEDDEKTVMMNFLPYTERTIQRYGVVIENLFYYHEVFNKYINRIDSNNDKRKFLFRKDPRELSIIYFLDPELNEYFEIPFRNISNPPISKWELKECVTELNRLNIIVNEESIMEARKRHIRLEEKALIATKKKRLRSKSRLADKRNENCMEVYKNNAKESIEINFDFPSDIKPFNNIDYGKFERKNKNLH